MAPGLRQKQTGILSNMPLLKKLFWAYFLLLIFEGALRKWVAPSLSAPLLLVRDPVALWIIVEAYRTGKWPKNWSIVTSVLAFALLGLCFAQVIVGGNPLIAAVYGLRSYLLPFPVAFIMGENIDAEELRKFGVCTLWLLLPLTLLEVAQYLASPTSFLNRGASEGGGQIYYVEGHVRASATFSFVSGPTNYVPMAAAFVLYALMSNWFARKWLSWAATAAVVLSVPVIGSRSLAFVLIGVVACAGIGAMLGAAQLLKSLKIVVPCLVLSFLVSYLSVFSAASSSFKERLRNANSSEGGSTRKVVTNRMVTPMVWQLEQNDFSSNAIGMGMGQGANAIAKMMTGRVFFPAGENELGRMMGEFGPIPGVAFMLFRLVLALILVAKALAQAHNHEPLALLLTPLTFPALFFSSFEQPTLQGFMVIGLAFTLAALNLGKPVPVPAFPRNVRRLPLRYSARRTG
jgi:hypothetical protein